MNNHKHIINKVFVEVNTPDTKTAYYLKDHLDVFLKQSLFPSIELYFNSLIGEHDYTLRFDNLDLNIKSSSIYDQVQLQLDIINSLKKQIFLKNGSSLQEKSTLSSLIIDRKDKNVNTFFYFLKTGQNPWWNSDFDRDVLNEDFIGQIISEKSFKPELRKLLQNQRVKKRLIYQFTDGLLGEILFDNKDATKPLKKYLTKSIFRNRYWEIIINYFVEGKLNALENDFAKMLTKLKKEVYGIDISSDEILNKTILSKLKKSSGSVKDSYITILKKRLLQKYKSKNGGEISTSQILIELYPGLTQEVDKEVLRQLIRIIIEEYDRISQYKFEATTNEIIFTTSELVSEQLDITQFKDHEILVTESQKEKDTEVFEDRPDLNKEVYIKNAGLVLLHPYLSRFFLALKLADDIGNLKPDKIELAVHLLHYVATKKEQQPESSLVFEKLLCGFPLEKPIQRAIKLSKNQKQEAESLLMAVLKNWQVLKNTSPDGLREGFIQRDGKLIMSDQTKYRIIVERKTQDILIEQLPWNLTMIKLPWVDKLIFVDW